MSRSTQFIAIFSLALFLGGFHAASAAFNTEINYQGKLTDTSNNAVADGDYNFKFRVCATSGCTGGSDPLWTETREGADKVAVSSGIFSVLLGSVTSIASVDFNQSLWLEVQVGGTGSPSYETLTPRKKLGAVAAAFEADKLDGLDSTAFLRASNNLSDLASSSTARTNLGLVIGTDVQAYDDELRDIASSTPTKGDLLTSDGTDWLDFSVGTDGYLLMASSTAANGIAWDTGYTSLDNIGDPIASSTIEIGSTTLTIDSAAASSTFVIDGDTGRIGIGTASPTEKFTLSGGIFTQTSGGTPEILGGIDAASSMNDVYVSGNYAYAVNNDGASDFKIIDITGPSSPAVVGSANDGAVHNRVFIAGKYAYVVTNSVAGTCSGATLTGCELRIYDISNPSSPSAVAGVDIAAAAYAVYVSGKYAYVGLDNAAVNEFRIYDVSNPASPVQVTGGELEFGATVRSIYVAGKYAYIGHASAFRIIDISNPAAPSDAGGVTVSDAVYRIYASGRYLYLVNGAIAGTCSGATLTGCEFRIYDITNPTSIVAVGGYDTTLDTLALSVAGKYAYIGTATNAGGDEFFILDISSPASPTNVGSVEFGTNVRGISVSGKYAYLVHDSITGNEFRILDIIGIDVPSATIGSTFTDYLTVSGKARLDQSLYVGTSLNVGAGGIFSQGPISILSAGTGTLGALDIKNSAGTSLLYVRDDGNVGIGTTSPSSTVHVVGGAARFDGPLALGSQQTMTANAATSSVSVGSHFVTANTASTTVSDFTDGIAGQIIAIETGDANTAYDCTANATFNCGTTDIVAETGNTLTWMYDGTVWNLINWMNTKVAQTGADIAEFFPSQQALEAGDLVAVDATRSLAVRRTNDPHDKQMIGIVSTQPGITLGEGAEHTYPVALAGRVPVKVSLENGPIQVGDLITSSSEEGVGMRATKSGRVVGIALEPFDFAQGENQNNTILVFVNPHWSVGSLDENGLLAGGNAQPDSGSNDSLLAKLENTIRAAIESFTGTVKTAGNWIFEKITAKTVRVEKLELVDQGTGEIYCTWLENGEWVKVERDCDDQNSNDQNVNEDEPPAQNPPAETRQDVLNSGGIQAGPPACEACGGEPTPEPAPTPEPPAETSEETPATVGSDPTSPSDDGAEPPAEDPTTAEHNEEVPVTVE